MNKLIQTKADIKKLQNTLKTQRKRVSQRFRAEHKHIFIFLHVIMVFIVLFNFGALTLTHFMVNKPIVQEATAKGEDIQYFEVVKGTSKIHNLTNIEDLGLSPEETKVMNLKILALFYMLFKQSLIWAVLYSMYYIYYRKVHTYNQLYLIIAFVAFYFCLTGYDFFFDLGIMIAEVKYG